MKKIFLLLFSFLFSITLFAKPTPIDSLKQKVKSLETNTKTYSKINDSLFSINSSLINANNNFKKEIDYNEKLLEKYNTLNNTIFTIIGILIAVFGLAIPLLGYFFVYKPAKDELKESKKLLNDIENNMNKLFSDYTLKNKEELIDNALINFETNNIPEISNSIGYLKAHRHEGFNDKQIFRLIKLIKNKNSDSDIFMRALLSTENEFTEEFFIDYLRKNSTDAHLSIYTILYFATYNKVKYMDDIAEYIIQTSELTGTIASIKTEDISFATLLINNDKLANGIDNQTLINYASYMDKYAQEEIAKLDLHNSKLYQKYLSINNNSITL